MNNNKIFFVVPWAGYIWGSTFMRGFQLCDLARAHLSDRYQIALARMPVKQRRLPGKSWIAAQRIWAATRPRGAVYVMTKQCIDLIDPQAAEILQSRAAAVLFDYVDGDMATMSTRGADIHLASSLAQRDYLVAQHGVDRVALLPHGYDTRFPLRPPQPEGPLRAVYVGVGKFSHIPQALADKVPVLNVTEPEHMEAVFCDIGPYNLHYCVRPPTDAGTKLVFKPFTKGVTAAACGANVLVNRDTHDAEALLGAEYPYLIESAAQADILEGFARVEADIGGPDWRRACDIMAELAHEAAPARAAERLDQIVAPLLA